jgi:hypothetical protein
MRTTAMRRSPEAALPRLDGGSLLASHREVNATEGSGGARIV